MIDVVDASWTDDDDALLAELLSHELDAEALPRFISRVSPRLPPPAHLAPLIDTFQRTRQGPVRAVIELPPRHAKTTTAMHGLAWRLNLDPVLTHCYVTYSQRLAESKSRIARRLTTGSGVRLAKDQANLGEWRTEQGGGLLASGIGGSLTGWGVNGIAIVDDPIKNRKEAESKLIRDGIWDWFTDVLWSRLEDEASCFVVQTRWHPDDLIGRLLAGDFENDEGDPIKFERIRLPAVCEDADDLLGRAIGDALWPERFGIRKLDEIRRLLGPYSWASLYQQRPRARGDKLFAGVHLYQREGFVLDGHRLIVMCDPAATTSTKSNHSAALVLAAKGYGADMRVWVLDHFRGRVEIPALCRRLVVLQRQYYGAPVGAEAVAGFKSVPQILRELEPTLRVLDVKPVGDKYTRALPASAAWADGRIFVPSDRPWTNVLVAELEAFTGLDDPEDDQVDCLAHGFNVLFAARAPRRRGSRRATELPYG